MTILGDGIELPSLQGVGVVAQSVHDRRHGPYRLARDEFTRQGGPRGFDSVFMAHLELGVVWSGPRSFALCRQVSSGWFAAQLLDPLEVATDERADAWWLYLLAGDWADAVGHLPRALPWIGWERHGRCRWHRTDVIVRKYAQRL